MLIGQNTDDLYIIPQTRLSEADLSSKRLNWSESEKIYVSPTFSDVVLLNGNETNKQTNIFQELLQTDDSSVTGAVKV